MHHIYDCFWYSPENSKKLTRKPHFVVGIQKFLDHAVFCRMGYTPIFGQMKRLIDLHNPGMLHWYSIYGCQVIYFQSCS